MSHIWAKYMEEVEHLRHVPQIHDIYKKRKETIERVFAICLRYTNYRGLTKVKVHVAFFPICVYYWKSKQKPAYSYSETGFVYKLEPRHTSRLFYFQKICYRFWSEQQDLNLRPPRPKRGALPGCAMPRRQKFYTIAAAMSRSDLFIKVKATSRPPLKSLIAWTATFSASAGG